MKVQIYSIGKVRLSETELPKQFSEEYRPDLIGRAVQNMQKNRRQPYGATPEAGKNYSAKLSRRRKDFKGAYGKAISRVPRKTMSRRGSQFHWVGALAPGTVGGRRSHPPKSEKIWARKINDKERQKALRSALAAAFLKDVVKERGHLIPEDYPFLIEGKAEELTKTHEVMALLEKFGFAKELAKTKEKRKMRAGKGKNRGRKYKKKKSLLLVVSQPCSLLKSAVNIEGVDVVPVKNLNTEDLAPGALPGRAVLFTDKAVEAIKKENLFQ